ncbi:uncharacterized protein LOC144638149 isoform X2 [Oculina patagonica]
MFVPLFPNQTVLCRNDHQCSSGEIRIIQCIDEHGNHHSKKIRFCQCEHPTVTLVRLHLWPGSPDRPTTAFQFRLMDQATDMFISCKVSLKEFADVLEMKRPLLQPKIVSSIYSILNSGCFEEYRFFKYHLQHLVRHCPDIDNGSNCPVCPEEKGILIECMDACFGLSRKRSQGYGFATPKHQGLFFGDQDDVDNFVDHYSGTSVSEQNCNHFHAGEVLPNLRSKGKNKLFDEKVVFGSVCRHDFPKSFISIKHGERISYSVYEIQKLKEELKPKGQIIVMYDVACILSKHIQNNESLSALANVPLAIPIFHCYGHKATCQVKFSPRRTKGVGLTDGEGTERLWSFLRDFSTITKEMSPEKRIDTLTDGVLHYGKGLVKKLGPVLKSKLLRAKELLSKTNKQLDEMFKSLPVLTQEWDELYVELLLTSKTIRNDLAYAETTDDDKLLETQRKLDRNVKRLETLEKKHGVRQRWQEHEASFLAAKRRLDEKNSRRQILQLHKLASERTFLLEMKRKYASGQAIAIKLSKQITKATDSMRKTIASHNAIQGVSALNFDLAKDPSCELYANLQSCPEVEHVVPSATRRMVIELHCLRESLVISFYISYLFCIGL